MHLVPVISKVGGDASNRSDRMVEPMMYLHPLSTVARRISAPIRVLSWAEIFT